jgi:hypothetical protein
MVFAWLAWDCGPPIYSLASCWDHANTPCLTSNCGPVHLCLLSSWACSTIIGNFIDGFSFFSQYHFFSSFFTVLGEGTLWYLQKFLQYVKYIILEFTPSTILRTVSTGLIFPFTYMCTQYLHFIHLPTSFPHLLPPPTGTKLLRQDLFSPLVL